jgi:transcriptional regulator with XRE-family HTH domain
MEKKTETLAKWGVVLEETQKAQLMKKDGYTTEQIAEALGYTPTIIESVLEEKMELGSPEEILQESLKRVLSLIPIAEAQYRNRPTTGHAYALTSFLDSTKGLIEQLYSLRGKEEMYRSILLKVLQPFCREMVKCMLAEVTNLKGDDPYASDEVLKRFSTNLGKKFQEAYRKSSEDLAGALGVNSDAKARVLSGED